VSESCSFSLIKTTGKDRAATAKGEMMRGGEGEEARRNEETSRK
jgi:hypothetical protein